MKSFSNSRPAVTLLGAMLFSSLSFASAYAQDATASSSIPTSSAAASEDGLTVVARVSARSGNEAKLLSALRSDERTTRAKEPGCTGFEVLHVDGHANEFVLLEGYKDQAALETHKAAPYFAAFEDAVKRYATGDAIIKVYKQVN